MHAALAAAAADVMAADAQLDKAHKLGKGAVAFAHGDYAFLEADKSDANVTWRGHAYRVLAQSSTLVRSSTGEALFNSKLGAPSHSATSAAAAPLSALTGWKAWAEPITSAAAYPRRWCHRARPSEMTNVTAASPHLPSTRRAGAPIRRRRRQARSCRRGRRWRSPPSSTAAPPVRPTTTATATTATSLWARRRSRAASGAGSTLTLLAEELGAPTTASRRRGRRGCRPRRRWMARRWRHRRVADARRPRGRAPAGDDRGVGRAGDLGALPSAPTAATWYQARFAIAGGRRRDELLVNATGLGRGRMWVNGRASAATGCSIGTTAAPKRLRPRSRRRPGAAPRAVLDGSRRRRRECLTLFEAAGSPRRSVLAARRRARRRCRPPSIRTHRRPAFRAHGRLRKFYGGNPWRGHPPPAGRRRRLLTTAAAKPSASNPAAAAWCRSTRGCSRGAAAVWRDGRRRRRL